LLDKPSEQERSKADEDDNDSRHDTEEGDQVHDLKGAEEIIAEPGYRKANTTT